MVQATPVVFARYRGTSWLHFPNMCSVSAVVKASEIKPISISWGQHFCEELAHTTWDIQLEYFSVYKAFTQIIKNTK